MVRRLRETIADILRKSGPQGENRGDERVKRAAPSKRLPADTIVFRSMRARLFWKSAPDRG
jgi:hypothetical protein